jgi:cellulose synthase/poly-beta-1,6-N-acetylglucosamine synthase-like glycosyltransferase/peptidoglycan/xylan/chitin deacetylase (PgdA/CDA1 family)
MVNKPVFFDATGRRAIGVSIFVWSMAAICTVLGTLFVASLLSVPQLSSIRLPGQLSAVPVAPGLLHSAEALAEQARERRAEALRERLVKAVRRHVHPSAQNLPVGRPLAIAFYPNWSLNAYDSLKVALPELDWVMPTWLNLDGPDLVLKQNYNQQVYTLIRSSKPTVAILPVVQNASLGKWDGPGLAKLLANPKRRSALANDLASFVGTHKLQGITVDFEQLPNDAQNTADVDAFLQQLYSLFQPHGWIVSMAAPLGDDKWPFAEYARFIDYTILMAYDEHIATGPSGSIASQSWYEKFLDKRMRELPPTRTIIGIGSYAYDWNGGTADSLAVQDAIVAAHDSSATIDFDDASNTPHFTYIEDDATRHEVWFLDGVTAYNQIHAAAPYQPAGFALWRLGSEDPSVLPLLDLPYGAPAPVSLRHIPVVEEIDFEGAGEILRVEAAPVSGSRSVEIDPQTGDIDDETYTKLPSGYVIRQFGAAGRNIALTFDDGPDPQWTPAILDILKAKHVPATFFIIGANAQANPTLMQRILAEGNEIGNHTFTHPNLADTSSEGVRIELNATQRLFEALTGRSMRLFRPPYLGDAEPTDDDEIAPVQVAQDMGYITVGEHVDPVDWGLPGTNVIVQRALKQVASAKPEIPRNIVLLHDAGGDRSQTVAALPAIIDSLRAQGYTFVPVSTIAGLTRDQAMPRLSPTLSLMTDQFVFMALSFAGYFLYYCFLCAIALSMGRLLILVGLSLANRRYENEQSAAPIEVSPFHVSVIVPAYNEEKLIVATVQRILDSDYRNMDIIVVDDGSEDRTSARVRSTFGSNPCVSLMRIANSGKAAALNAGLTAAKGEVVVALDADTQFNRDTISRLVRWFADPDVGAVAGNAKVGNRINIITRWQALEYIVAQNLERRALAALGTLTVVPGAVGAWRRTALKELGGFRTDTLAEDQDLTIALQKAGYSVLFDSSAIAWTEAPATVRGLAKQRFRWAFGTLQCLWKYRSLNFNPRYGTLGMVALPQVWLFQIALTAIAPLADLLLIWQLISEYLAHLQHGAEYSDQNLLVVAAYYGIFILVDLAAATFGFLMEKREDWKLLLWLPLQRFGYRQLMYYVVVRSISTALRGVFVGWGKLERTGTVSELAA